MVTLPDISTSSKRPWLADTHSITSLGQLHGFLNGASLRVYDDVYSLKEVDWDFVEQVLERQVFKLA